MSLSRPNTGSRLFYRICSNIRPFSTATDPNLCKSCCEPRHQVISTRKKAMEAVADLKKLMDSPNRSQLTTSDFSRIRAAFAYLHWEPFLENFELPIKHDAEGNYHVRIDLPGIGKDGVKLRMEDDVLHVTGEEDKEADPEFTNYKFDCCGRKFTWRFKIDSRLYEIEKMKAHLKCGTLRIVIPKRWGFN